MLRLAKKREVVDSIAVITHMHRDLKRQLETVCAAMSLTITDAISIVARRVTREQRLPFKTDGLVPIAVCVKVRTKRGA